MGSLVWIAGALVVGVGCGYGFRGLINRKVDAAGRDLDAEGEQAANDAQKLVKKI